MAYCAHPLMQNANDGDAVMGFAKVNEVTLNVAAAIPGADVVANL